MSIADADADRSPLRHRLNAATAAAAKAEESSSSSSSSSVTASRADFPRPDETAASTGEDSEGSTVAPPQPLPGRDDHAECNGPASASANAEAATTLVNEYAVARLYRPSTPAHRRIKESPLSSDSIFKQSHAGLLNLCIVVLVAVNGRLIIENLMKYGLLIRTGFWFSSKSLKDWPLLMCCLTLPIFPLCSFVVEKLVSRKWVSEPIVISLHVIITTGVLLYPALVILRCDSAVMSGIHLMLFASTYWLKLVSYAHTNYDLRSLTESKDKEDIYGSYDVNLKSLAYFMVAPTLCYQTSYPRTACVRKGWVTRQLVKLVIFTGLMGFIIEQYINPIVKNSQHPLKGNFLYCMERVLKLSVPTLYVWLCMFYCLFHLWLNILAELLRFGDREFYKDWWNAKTIDEYWRMWNMPVHKWMARHVYFPCLRCGLSKGVAVLVAFFISAIFHELCVGVPCHIFKFWAFLGIMFQVPLVLLTNYLRKKSRNDMVGNIIFWSCFSIFGQPMCVLLYYHDLMNRKVKITP